MMDFAGSFFFAFLFILSVDQGLRGDWTAWLLAAQSGLTAFRIVIRKKSTNKAPFHMHLLAWLSALSPLAMLPAGSLFWPIPGLALSVWALIALGDSFSVSPADRGLVERGPYHFIRHPMYAGELFALIGACVSNPVIWNWIVLTAFGMAVYLRITVEESIIGGYPQYAKAIIWRLIPYVW